MNGPWTDLVGWIPAVVLPTATFLQWWKILRSGSTEGVSLGTWSLFAVANLSLYVFTGRYAAPQAILAMLLTAVLNIAIVATVLAFRKRETKA